MSFLVSVCVPCYNAAPYISASLDSLLRQTWKRLEIIVVNDGSTDDSGAILNSYRKQGVKVIHQSNKGQCAAANRAFVEATGDYIKFFDADDLLTPDYIERQMVRLEGIKDAVASAEWGRFYGDDVGTFQLDVRTQRVWRDMPALDWLVEAWSDAQPMMQCALWLIPREILTKSGGWDESLTLINDFEFFSRVLCHAREVCFTEGATLLYRSGLPNSLSGQKTRAAVESAFHSVLKGTSHLLAARQDVVARRSCANIMQEFVYTYYPSHRDLCDVMEHRVLQLGGSDLEPTGGQGFQRLRKFVGWRAARRLHLLLSSLKRHS